MTSYITPPILTSVPGGAVALTLSIAIAVMSIFLLRHAMPALATQWICRALGARPLRSFEAPEWRDAVRRLSASAEIEEPTLLAIPHPQANVYVFGGVSGVSVLAVTEGALRNLGAAEAEAAVGAALARATGQNLMSSTVAAYIGLMASTAAGLGIVRGHEAEDHPFGWMVGVPFLLVGAVLARSMGGAVPGGRADLRGASISGRALESARLLEHMEFTAHVAPMAVSSALVRLALVDPRGEPEPFSFRRMFPAPPPSAPRAALLRASRSTPDTPKRAQAA